jgi:hypothetical protein
MFPTKKKCRALSVDTFKRGTFMFQFDSQTHLQEFTSMYFSAHSTLLPRSNLHKALEEVAGDDEVLDLARQFMPALASIGLRALSGRPATCKTPRLTPVLTPGTSRFCALDASMVTGALGSHSSRQVHRACSSARS